jgi:hypothetical protein
MMNFPVMWRAWISECLRTVTRSVYADANPTNELSMSRGLRQVDPLSSFSFLFAAEGFNSLFSKVVRLESFMDFK